MFEFKENIFTYVLTGGVLNINSEYGVKVVAMKLTAGAGTFSGTMKLGSVNSAPINLVVNQPVTVDAGNGYIDSFTIDCLGGGTVEIIARK